jgi:multicomponent Na+:H+ antiporter subunit D
MVLNRYGSVDEVSLHGRARDAPFLATLYVIAGLALSGLPPFGSGLGKAIGEDALGHGGYWFGPPLFVLVSAMTGGAVLRAGGRIFFGIGPRPQEDGEQTSGDEEKSETGEQVARRSVSLVGPIIVLLAGCLAIGLAQPAVDALGAAASRFVDHAGYLAQALHRAAAGPAVKPEGIDWTVTGVVLGLISTSLALAVAATGCYAETMRRHVRGMRGPTRRVLAGLHAVHSGHVGDYVAWLLVGVVALTALVGVPLR